MKFFQWLRGRQTVRSAMLSLYRRGLARGEKRNRKGAMDDYTSVIDAADAPADVRAMALYNRALLHVSRKDFRRATDDLQAVLAIELRRHDIKSAATRTLDRIRRQQGIHGASANDAAHLPHNRTAATAATSTDSRA